MSDGWQDEDRLPWLEPVEEVKAKAAPGSGGRLLLIVAALVLFGGAAAAYFWTREPGASEGHGELIAAPPGPYKVPAPDPGGMEVEGKGDSAFATSEGAEPNASIDINAIPEAPILGPGGQAGGKAAAPDAEGVIQLGAFASQSAALAAWKALSERFAYLAPLAQSVVPVEVQGKTLYRLRASGSGAASICGRLRAAQEDCESLD